MNHLCRLLIIVWRKLCRLIIIALTTLNLVMLYAHWFGFGIWKRLKECLVRHPLTSFLAPLHNFSNTVLSFSQNYHERPPHDS